MSKKINLIGAGRVGQTLLRCPSHVPDIIIGDICTSTVTRARTVVAEIGAGRAVERLDQMASADIWLLTVPDTKIAAVADDLASAAPAPAIAVHCSGFHTASVMSPLSDNGWALASAHPMLSFADPKVSAARFPGTWVGLEGDPAALDAVDDLFTGIGARTFRLPSDTKALYHAAAVITNNFTTVLQAVAREAWDGAGVPVDAARELNESLLRSTVENLEHFGPAEALTGPAARGDRAVVEAQGAQVSEWRADVGQLYALLSDMATRLKATGKTGLS